MPKRIFTPHKIKPRLWQLWDKDKEPLRTKDLTICQFRSYAAAIGYCQYFEIPYIHIQTATTYGYHKTALFYGRDEPYTLQDLKGHTHNV